MKIIHLYADNMQMFIDAVNGTDCRLNGSNDVEYLSKSLQLYNARDVLGLIVFKNPMTKSCIKLVKAFDSLFALRRLPIVIVNDFAQELYDEGYFKVKNSDLYLVNSEDNSISDIDLRRIFVTLLGSASELYDLSGCRLEHQAKRKTIINPTDSIEMSEQLKALFKTLNRGELDENSGNSGSLGAGTFEKAQGIGEEIFAAFEGED